VFAKGQYHFQTGQQNCLLWERFPADMCRRIFKITCHLSTEGRKIALYKNASLYNYVHLLKNIKIFSVQFSSATCSFRLLYIILLRNAILKIRELNPITNELINDTPLYTSVDKRIKNWTQTHYWRVFYTYVTHITQPLILVPISKHEPSVQRQHFAWVVGSLTPLN
jgi:hypothetical protein